MKIQTYLLKNAKYKGRVTDDLQANIGENSWYLKLPLFTCRNLLMEDYGYLVQAFSCKCGSERIFISGKEVKHIHYRCRECGNGNYLDATNVEEYGKEVLHIDMSAVCTIEGKKASIRVYTKIPVDVDLAAGEKICYENKKIAEITVTLDNDVEMQYVGRENVTDDVILQMESILWHYVAKHYFHMTEAIHDYVEYMSDMQLKEAVSRLLRYPALKESEFLFWVMDDALYYHAGEEKSPEAFLRHVRNERDEKSVKRALYRRYGYELEKGGFHPLTPYVVCRAFRDPNYVARLLEAYDFALTREMRYQSISLKATAHRMLIDFLKTRYSEKRLVKIFETMRDGDTIYWEDSVEMFSALFDRESIADIFRTVKADVREIHDELVRCAHLVGHGCATISFEYTEAQRKPCGIWKERFEIVLPKDSGELYLWAKTLHNCLHGYVDAIRYRQTTVYGIKENGTLCYAAEIRNDRLVQLRGAFNAEADEAIRQSIDAWYRTFFDNNASDFA